MVSLSIQGSNNIFGPDRSIFVRIIWICLLILSVYALVYYIRGAYIKWLIEPDIITKIRIRKVEKLPEFAITVCPQVVSQNSILNITEYDKKVRERLNFSITNEEYSQLLVNSFWCQNIDQIEIMKHHRYEPFTTWSKVISTLLKGYHDSSINSGESPETFYKTLTSFGVCSTFGMYTKAIYDKDSIEKVYNLTNDNEPDIEWSPDSQYSSEDASHPRRMKHNKRGRNFEILSKFLSVENACNRKESVNSSFKVIVHQPNEFPTFLHESIDIKFGRISDILVSIKSERSRENLIMFDPEIRKCIFDDEKKLKYFKTYSKIHCELECIDKHIDCDLLDIPRSKNISIGFKSCRSDIKSNYEVLKSRCKCYPSCNSLHYKLIESDKTFKLYYKKDLRTFQDDKFVNHFSILLSSNEVEEIERFSAYTLQNFIADVGGYLGLFVGCSLLSIVEIVMFTFRKILSVVRKKNQPNDIESSLDLKEEVKGLKEENQMMREELKEIRKILKKAVDSEGKPLEIKEMIVEELE